MPLGDRLEHIRRRHRHGDGHSIVVAVGQLGDCCEQSPARDDLAAIVGDEDLLAAGVEPNGELGSGAAADPGELLELAVELFGRLGKPSLVRPPSAP